MKIDKRIIVLSAAVVVIGFLSGVVGELWVNSFLLPDPYLNFKNYYDLSKKINDLISSQPAKRLNERDIDINDMIQKIRPAVVEIYKYKNFAKGTINNSLLPADFVSEGVVITNDGWIMTDAVAGMGEKSSYWIVLNDRKIYRSEKIYINQKLGIGFIKIKADNLPVAEFELKGNLVDGQTVYLFGQDSEVATNHVRNLNYNKLDNFNYFIHNSEDFYKFISFQSDIEGGFVGSPVVTLNGKMAGIWQKSKSRAVPVDYITKMMQEAVKDKKWNNPYLGVNFIDLSEIMNPSAKRTKGALIIQNQGIKADSPALGILRSGDIIIKVENDELNGSKDLCWLLSFYKAGDKIKFRILRDGAEMDADIILK